MPTTDKNYLVKIHSGLADSLERQAAALPDGFNKQRFMQNCMTVLQDGNQDYSKCNPNTVVRTLLQGAFLGVDFFNGEAYAIVYGTKCQFQLDYKGSVKVCKKYSQQPIEDIYAKVVREGDNFTEGVKDGKPFVDFYPVPFNNGKIIGAFAVCLFKDGSLIEDSMSVEEIEHTRKTYSRAANSKAWVNSYSEMCKKTVLRRLCKMIDLDFDTSEQARAYEEGSPMDVKGSETKYEAKDVYADDVVEQDETIEADYTEVVEDAEKEEVQADE